MIRNKPSNPMTGLNMYSASISIMVNFLILSTLFTVDTTISNVLAISAVCGIINKFIYNDWISGRSTYGKAIINYKIELMVYNYLHKKNPSFEKIGEWYISDSNILDRNIFRQEFNSYDSHESNPKFKSKKFLKLYLYLENKRRGK